MMVVPGSIPKIILSVANSLFICYFVAMKIPYKTNQFWTSLIKILVVSLSFFVIYLAIRDIQPAQWQLMFDSTRAMSLVWIGLVLSMMNWLLEGLKWKTLIQETKPISVLNAFAETLKAHAVSIITPNKVGEFGAKASFYPRTLRSKVLKFTLTGQVYQLLATCGFGFLGLSFSYVYLDTYLKWSIALVLAILFVTGVFIYAFDFKTSWLKFFKSYVQSMFQLSNTMNARVFGLSVLRYLCFSHQYFLFLWVFQPDLNYAQTMPILFSIYFISSFVPTVLILDAGLKAGLGLLLLGSYLSSEFIITVSLLMWIFNFGTPAIFGNLLLLKPKHFRVKLQNFL
jgi:hypothetical protein